MQEISTETYSIFAIGDEKIYFKALHQYEYDIIVKASMMYNLLTAEEKELPQGEQAELLMQRVGSGEAQLSSPAFTSIVTALIQRSKLSLDKETVIRWKSFLDERGVEYRDTDGTQLSNQINLGVKIITLCIMPPTLLPIDGERLGPINPYRAAFINLLRTSTPDEGEEE